MSSNLKVYLYSTLWLLSTGCMVGGLGLLCLIVLPAYTPDLLPVLTFYLAMTLIPIPLVIHSFRKLMYS